MKYIGPVTIGRIPVWSPTNGFRWLEKPDGTKTLQQHWQSDDGQTKWIDVETHKEGEV